MKVFLIGILLICVSQLKAQELYPSTEPASNMSAKSIGIRLNNDLFPVYDGLKDDPAIKSRTMYRFNPELMWGIDKMWMLHANLYASNIHQDNFKFEGGSVYVKYRFIAFDQVQSHFRMALYGKASLINNPVQYSDINLAGDNTGLGTGLIATQLLHKVALSFTGGYLRAFNNLQNDLAPGQARYAINYSLSTGYLFLPFHYKNYRQPNLNLYVELLGKWNPGTKESYLDIAPALQVILNSLMRIDFVYQKQLYGNMLRMDHTLFEFRLEYTFLNVYKSKRK